MKIILENMDDAGFAGVEELLIAVGYTIWTRDLVVALLAGTHFGEFDTTDYYGQRKLLIERLRDAVMTVDEAIARGECDKQLGERTAAGE